MIEKLIDFKELGDKLKEVDLEKIFKNNNPELVRLKCVSKLTETLPIWNDQQSIINSITDALLYYILYSSIDMNEFDEDGSPFYEYDELDRNMEILDKEKNYDGKHWLGTSYRKNSIFQFSAIITNNYDGWDAMVGGVIESIYDSSYRESNQYGNHINNICNIIYLLDSITSDSKFLMNKFNTFTDSFLIEYKKN